MGKQNNSESFRNSISTIDKQGKREWVFPKKPSGKLHNYRLIVGWIFLAFFFVSPFIKLNGEPLLLINIIERRFILFGNIFWPQDTFIFAIMMLTILVFIVVFTVALGRIWCGWACPQTLFMEILFRKVEYLIDGDANKQRKLKAQGWNFEKIWKRTIKYLLFLLLSFIITNTLFAWVIGVEELFKLAGEPISEHLSGFIALMMLTGIFMFIYSWFREQVCSILCPYGRLQGVLLDSNSIIVAYDYNRGEPRGPFKKSEDRTATEKGDCIDCKQCVEVCPTAIDIRNGTQLECINCTACIDACNHTMQRVGLPKGLIRFDSENSIKTGQKLKLNFRLGAYIAVLVLLMTFLVYLLFSRSDVETSILRTPGLLFQEQANEEISNLYNIKVINKRREQFPIELKLLSHKGRITMAAGDMVVNEASSTEGVFFVYMKKSGVHGKIPIKIGVFSGEKEIEVVEVTFVAPE
ncbi:MAG: cytochrome c oxidase accessory protein CcoG [Bacteroidales bacterium]|nr:cytochrome c oxidase accessory protein CcoG [Bacteroidales bacterium]MCF8458749.1 cytochrome c oxidase accessory protein CcoG [Bacteroidales bacterium]